MAGGTAEIVPGIPNNACKSKKGALVDNKTNEDQGTAGGTKKHLSGIPSNVDNLKKGALITNKINGKLTNGALVSKKPNEDQGTAGGAAEIVPGIENNTCKLKKGALVANKTNEDQSTALALWEELGGLADPALIHDSTTPHLLLRMTEVESRLYATTSLGLDGGDVQVFLDFLEDERDKRLGMIEDSNDYRGAGSSDVP